MMLPMNRKVTYMIIASIKNEIHVKEKSWNPTKKSNFITITDSPATVILINIFRVPMPCLFTSANRRRIQPNQKIATPVFIIVSLNFIVFAGQYTLFFKIKCILLRTENSKQQPTIVKQQLHKKNIRSGFFIFILDNMFSPPYMVLLFLT